MLKNESRNRSPVFLAQTDNFSRWLARRMLDLPVSLSIEPSSKLPAGLKREVRGAQELVNSYVWPAMLGRRFTVLDWPKTQFFLASLSNEMRAAVHAADDAATFACTEEVVKWGGQASPTQGARAFLRQLANNRKLTRYLLQVEAVLDLDSCIEANIAGRVLRMGSMLAKVHAVFATDGLPIYDSRVAAAIAALAELYRRDCLAPLGLPRDLLFPKVDDRKSQKHPNRRRLDRLFEDGVAAGPTIYANDCLRTQKWSWAMVRLGRVLRSALVQEDRLLAEAGTIPQRMMALQAALFMIGYDLRSLRPALR